MPKNKHYFNKNNCKKYLLLPGKTDACNAEGELLPTLLVPVAHNHRPGSSLFFPKFENIGEASGEQNSVSALKFAPAADFSDDQEVRKYGNLKEPDLEKILGEFDDADYEIEESYEEEDCDEESDLDEESDFDEESSKSECDEKEVQNDPNNISLMTQFNRLSVSAQNALYEQRSTNHISQQPQIEDDNSSYSSAESDQFYDAEEPEPTHSKYLFTSAKQDCPESIKILNEQFEKILEDYDDDQIGALDDEEIFGNLTTDSKLLDSYILSNPEKELELGNYDSDTKEQILRYAEQEREHFVEVVIKAPVEFDCESILSTYSNIYNHPVVIKEESKIKKIKIPVNPLRKKLVKSQLKHLGKESDENSDTESEDEISVATSYNVRSKSETLEEKKERKKLFKEAKRESRILKKENKIAFKNEKKFQTIQMINANKNKGIRLL